VDLDAPVGQLDRIRERVSPVARAEHRAAARQRVLHAGRRQLDVFLLVEPLEAVADPEDLPAIGLPSVQRDGANDAVETRAIAAAGEDADARTHRAKYR